MHRCGIGAVGTERTPVGTSLLPTCLQHTTSLPLATALQVKKTPTQGRILLSLNILTSTRRQLQTAYKQLYRTPRRHLVESIMLRDAHDILRGHAALTRPCSVNAGSNLQSKIQCTLEGRSILPQPEWLWSSLSCLALANRVPRQARLMVCVRDPGGGCVHGDPIGCCLFCHLQSTAANSYPAAVHAGAAIVRLATLVAPVTTAGHMTR